MIEFQAAITEKTSSTEKINRKQLTANDSTSERTRSPMSTLVSCPNCTSAPRKRRILTSLAVSCCAAAAAAAAEVMAGGGVIDPKLPPPPPPPPLPPPPMLPLLPFSTRAATAAGISPGGDELPLRLATCDDDPVPLPAPPDLGWGTRLL